MSKIRSFCNIHQKICIFARAKNKIIHLKQDFIKNMEIKVLGTGCATCKALFAAVEQVVAEMGIDATVTKEEDLMKIMEYNVMTLPALVVDGKVVAKGKLSAADIKNLLSK